MNRKTMLITLMFFSLYPCICLSIGIPITGCTTKMHSTINQIGDVSVVLVTKKVSSAYPYDKTSMWGGDEGKLAFPKEIISSITVVKNKQKIFIPLSAYADLGDPKNVELEALPAKRFRLVITGSDAAGSYEAILEFKNNEILKRKVVSGEFPDDAWEETQYKFNHLNN